MYWNGGHGHSGPGDHGHSGTALAEALARLPPRPTTLICGMMRGKDARSYLAPLASQAVALHAVPIDGAPRPAIIPEELAAAARAAGLAATCSESTLGAARSIGVDAAGPQRVVVCGSLYLAANVLRDNAAGSADGDVRLDALPPSLPPAVVLEDVVVALGANLGHRAQHIAAALIELRAVGEVPNTHTHPTPRPTPPHPPTPLPPRARLKHTPPTHTPAHSSLMELRPDA